MSDQLDLFAPVDRHPMVDVVVYDKWGRVLDVIPCSLGDRVEASEMGIESLHTACLWGYVAAKRASQFPPGGVDGLGDPVRGPCAARPAGPVPDVPDRDHDQHSEPEEPC